MMELTNNEMMTNYCNTVNPSTKKFLKKVQNRLNSSKKNNNENKIHNNNTTNNKCRQNKNLNKSIDDFNENNKNNKKQNITHHIRTASAVTNSNFMNQLFSNKKNTKITIKIIRQMKRKKQ